MCRRVHGDVVCADIANYYDSASISPSCFTPPICIAQIPRAWDRVAVPRAGASRRSDYKIYKRVTVGPKVDKRYQAAVTELECQGFGERKRTRTNAYVRPYGNVLSRMGEDTMTVGQESLDNARGMLRIVSLSDRRHGAKPTTEQVQRALQSIWKDNLRLRSSGSFSGKRYTYDAARLTWVPRKRHNTRWPVNPPGENCAFIAKLQPLVKFELHPDQVQTDEPAVPEQQNQQQKSTVRVSAPEEPCQQGHLNSRHHRRRTMRPSLDIIAESDNELPSFPVLTPGAKTRPMFTSPIKSAKGAQRFKTPTKVAESPLKAFTVTAPQINSDESTKATKFNGHSEASSPTNKEVMPRSHSRGLIHTDSDHGGRVLMTSGTNTETTMTTPATTVDESSNTNYYLAALPFFDAHDDAGVQNEPEHEAKRRFSLDNARRSDRRTDAKIIKRVSHWMEGNTINRAKNRRHSGMPGNLAATCDKPSRKRRHTLDVDVGRNLDIFGQQAEPAATGYAVPLPNTFTDSTSASSGLVSSTISMSASPLDKPASSKALSGIHNDMPAPDVQLEDEMDPAKTECVTEVMDQTVTAGDDGAISAVAEHAKAMVRGLEQDGPTKVDVEQIEDGDTLKGDIFSDNEDDGEGDSALADLHSFVRRARSSKERRDVSPSSPIFSLPKPKLLKKRYSGSTSAANSDAGSPKSKVDKAATTAAGVACPTNDSPRVPLGQKDVNKSPSPSKKRKLKGIGPQDAFAPATKKSGGRLVAPDFEDHETEAPAQPKKRRRKMEANVNGDIFNPDMFSNQDLTKRSSSSSGASSSAPDKGAAGASRRSSRIATSTTIKKTTPIPVRLPGSSTLDLGDMPVPSTAAVTARKADRDLAAETRLNTNRNKGGAVPVAVALVNLGAVAAGEGDQTTAVTTARKAGTKNVRWDEILARVQGEEPVVPSSAVTNVDSEVVAEIQEEEEEAALPSPPQIRFAASDQPGQSRKLDDVQPCGGEDEPRTKPQATTSTPSPTLTPTPKLSPAPVRRSARSAASRLPTRGGGLTPVKKKNSLPSSNTGSVVSKVSTAVAAGARARLGMAGPGTPGPRRGGRKGGR